MMKHKTKAGIRAAALCALLALMAVSCGKLDVVGTGSVSAFEKMLQALPEPVRFDEAYGGWSLAAPDGGARFIWSRNYAESPRFDALLELDAAPFLAAGLNPALLPEWYAFSGNVLAVGTKFGGETLTYEGAATPLASYQRIVKLKRDRVGYHGALDHYGVNLGDGNLFEFAKDMAANDKDIVFVLNPAPLLATGLDVSRLEGWVFAQVTVDDANGKPVQVDKLLKPFDLAN